MKPMCFVIALAACSSCKTGGHPGEEEDAPESPVRAPQATGPGVLLHCIGIQPPRAGDCERGHDFVEQIVAAARTHRGWDDALDTAAFIGVEKMPLIERIIAQNAALYISSFDWERRIDAIRLARRLAPPHADLDKLGHQPSPELAAWLGNPVEWHDRRAKHVPLDHEKLYRYTRVFRPLRIKELRVLISQLVAMDDQWRPHVTPIIGELEVMRGTIDDPTHVSACEAELSIVQRRCGMPAGLEPRIAIDEPDASTKPFVMPLGGRNRAACFACHGAPPNDVIEDFAGDEDAKSHLSERRAAFLRESELAFAKFRELYQQSLE